MSLTILLKKNQKKKTIQRCGLFNNSYPRPEGHICLWFSSKAWTSVEPMQQTHSLPLDWDPEDRTLGEEKRCGGVWLGQGGGVGGAGREATKRQQGRGRRLEKAAFTKTKNKSQNH